MKIQQVDVAALSEYAVHLKNLTTEDRYTRFCCHMQDAGIDSLILSMLYNQNDHYLFSAVIDGDICGFGHLAREGDDWELAVSVGQASQGQGVADKLIKHMITWGKTHGIHSVFMHCITQNTKIQHLARKHGLRMVERDGSEITTRVDLPLPGPMDYTSNFLHEQQEILEKIVNLQTRMVKNFNLLSRRDHVS
jgi:RimJ/RimL family protein N-acetyltransferase